MDLTATASPPIAMPATTLDRLRVNEAGRVMMVGGDPGIRRRLLEMGLTPGTRVRVVRFAPLGDPMDVEVRGYHLSLRRSEAGQIGLNRL